MTLLSFLGQDEEGARVLRALAREGIPAERVALRLRGTPVSAVLYDPEGRRQIYCDLKDIQDQTLDPAGLEELLSGCDLAALCNINFNRELIRAARRLGVTTATDVHVLSAVEDAYNRDFMENAEILFLSDEALPCPPADFLRRLRDRYQNRILVLGMGAQGAMLLERDREPVTVPAYTRGSVVNTVGAGDALFSAFVHCFGKGLSPRAALERAVVFAGIKIGFHGASEGFCGEPELEELLRRERSV